MSLEVDLVGLERAGEELDVRGVEGLCAMALASAGIEDGHLAVALVAPHEIRSLNLEHRGRDAPTDVLSFPVDADGPAAGPRELGDVVICPEEAADLTEAVVHGVLHLAGMDHEADEGEMLVVQAEILRWARG